MLRGRCPNCNEQNHYDPEFSYWCDMDCELEWKARKAKPLSHGYRLWREVSTTGTQNVLVFPDGHVIEWDYHRDDEERARLWQLVIIGIHNIDNCELLGVGA